MDTLALSGLNQVLRYTVNSLTGELKGVLVYVANTICSVRGGSQFMNTAL